jgi:GH43 family beta-xylosidase
MLLKQRLRYFFVFFLLLAGENAVSQKHFTNPLFSSGADPWIIEKNGFYYYTHTTGRNIVLYRSASLAGLKTAKRNVVWTPPDSTMYSKEIWAPELHHINGKWYFYFAADDGKNENHRIYVLENESADPVAGKWTFKGKIAALTDKWAIDGSVFQHKGWWYITWSGWEGDTNRQQDIYIARLKNPWTIDGERVRISSPVYDWERHGNLNDANNPPHVAVNEGPQFLKKGSKVYIVYSASGCWTDQYGLGLLTFKGSDNLLDSSSWKKSARPVFSTSAANKVFAPGHNSFFTSPDGKEDWILYHANSKPGQGCGKQRAPRAQKFSWTSDGTPNFGVPVKTGVALRIPSEKKKKKQEAYSPMVE